MSDDRTAALVTDTTGAEPELVVHRDAASLALVSAGRLVAALLDAQSARGKANLVLTGGGIGIALLESLATHPARDAVAWRAVDIWWGDERWVPAGDAQRNDQIAWEALLGRLALDSSRIHRMGSSDGEPSIDAASAGYSSALAQAGEPDVLLLGVGPEGHIASIFPRSPALAERNHLAAPVRSSPKPPSSRITMTMPAIRRARQVWLLASGASKADAVAQALDGTPERDCPAAGARGTSRTLWLVDQAAATSAL